MAKHCLQELEGLSPREKKQYLLEKVRAYTIGYTAKGYAKAGATSMHDVCRLCFCHCYEIGHTYLDNLCAAVKRGTRIIEPDFQDDSPATQDKFIQNLNALANSFGVQLSPQQIGALRVPNTVASLSCFAWMSSFFDAVGDRQPNHCEIHLEPTDIKEVHTEYHNAISDSGEDVFEHTSFLHMWTTCT